MSVIDRLTDDQARLISGAITKLDDALGGRGLRASEILTMEERHAVAHFALALPKDGEHATEGQNTDGPQQHTPAGQAPGT